METATKVLKPHNFRELMSKGCLKMSRFIVLRQHKEFAPFKVLFFTKIKNIS